MLRIFLAFLLFLTTLQGDTVLKIASYNVDNLFDLKKDGNEYSEYIPNTKSRWNKRNYKIKLNHISRVIKDIDADIISLEEVESLQALKDLRQTLKQKGLYYKYYKIADKKDTTTKVAILSKIPFVYNKEVSVGYSYRYRNILETKFKVNGTSFYIFTNHWKAKSGAESERIKSARVLLRRVKQIGFSKNIILVGDFNSDYQEYIKFKKERRLNNTNGYTGINHVLNTVKQTQKASSTKPTKNAFYNLWYDADEKDRYTYIFRGKKEALDNILISQPLLDKNNSMHYIHNSIKNLNKNYLFYKHKYINRWYISKGRVKVHKGKGYSDHLPVMAKFLVK